jgi:hypothetical protein
MRQKEMAMIELTEQQRQELEGPGPALARDPKTGETFVLIRQDVYDLVRKIVDGPNRRGWADPADDDLIRKLA